MSAWFMFLTFPIMVVRVNTVENVVEWRWRNMLFIGIGSFFLSFVWRYLIRKKERGKKNALAGEVGKIASSRRLLTEPKFYLPALVVLSIFALVFPFLFSMYQINIMITGLIYVMLGLGLNIVVGLAGLLDLGYVAFYAVGAYSYAGRARPMRRVRT